MAADFEIVDNTNEQTRPRYDDVNVPVIALIGVISALLTFITIAFVQGLTYHWQASFQDRTPDPKIQQAIDEQKSFLSANPQTGRISIEEAMQAVVDKHGQAGNASTTQARASANESAADQRAADQRAADQRAADQRAAGQAAAGEH